MIVAAFPRPANPQRPTLRELAVLVAVAREAEMMHLHGVRDDCPGHSAIAHIVAAEIAELLPPRLRTDEWTHRHIVAPASRQFAREER